jgi:predicted nucleic acid-binding protein
VRRKPLNAAKVRGSLDRSDTSIGVAESLIAEIVPAHSAVLLTWNRRHFERVPKLLLADRK